MKQLLGSKKRVVYFSMLAILMLTGLSYAIWQFGFLENNPNLAMSACFDLTFEEANDISLVNAYPMTDEEGKNLTPYTFTIKNKCSDFASYQVNLEVLNNSTLDSSYVKSEFNDRIKLVSSYPTTAKTLNNASTAYKLLSGYLNPNESITYNLKLWIDYNSTVEQSANKTYETKITIASTYKGTNPSELEECIKNYGENSLKCAIMAQADSSNSDCLTLNQDGSIKNPYPVLRKNKEPIVCTIEDDYGTSYYLRGSHTDNNVKFANSCWKILRVTGNGTLKMLYNGDLDSEGKCTIASGTHKGYEDKAEYLYNNIYYSDKIKYENDSYTLVNPQLYKTNESYEAIIDKYICSRNSSVQTCSYPMLIKSISKMDSSIYAQYIYMGSNVNYATIGNSYFINDSSLASVGYMYNDTYISESVITAPSKKLLSIEQSNSSNYYYGDTIEYRDNAYYIKNSDGTAITQLSWADNYTSLPGKYTCRSSSTSASGYCGSKAYKVLDTTSKENYMIAEYLDGGKTNVFPLHLGQSYTEINETYTLTNPIEVSAMEWYANHVNYQNYYICENQEQESCSNIFKIGATKSEGLNQMKNVKDTFYYGSDFVYDEQTQKYTLIDDIHLYDITNDTKQEIYKRRYTCFNSSDNTCENIYYILVINNSFDTISVVYIKLGPQEHVSDAIHKMIEDNNINVYDSAAKKMVDLWFQHHFTDKDTNYLGDAIYCNDRSVEDYGRWSGSSNTGNLVYKSFNSWEYNRLFLKCPSKRDAYTVNDSYYGNAALTYPIGLMTLEEAILNGDWDTFYTGNKFWLMTGHSENSHFLINSSGLGAQQGGSDGIRPVIALKPTVQIKLGTDGTALNPYEIE